MELATLEAVKGPIKATKRCSLSDSTRAKHYQVLIIGGGPIGLSDAVPTG